LLQYNPAERKLLFNDENQLDFGHIVIDEASTIDTPLTVSLICAIPSTAAITLVGHTD
jgi:ATP-dependent exoDNAse (exonuclease V) alpha subunit